MELQVNDIAADLPPVFEEFYAALPGLTGPDGRPITRESLSPVR